MTPTCRAALAAILALAPAALHAQAVISAEAVTDERRRGLSWSDGKPTGRLAIGIDPTPGLRLDAQATALRGSARHGGADAVADLSAAWVTQAGPVRLDLGATAHLFAGSAGRSADYVEVQAGARSTLGPVEADAWASYAPSQRAIGGSNLYLGAQTRVAVLGTPFSVLAGVGRSSGDVDDPVYALRLRPDGSYLDWRLGVERITGPVTLGLTYSGTDIGAPDRQTERRWTAHAGDRIVARIALTL